MNLRGVLDRGCPEGTNISPTKALLKMISFSLGGICEFPGGYHSINHLGKLIATSAGSTQMIV